MACQHGTPHITSKQFVEILKRFDKDGNGYIDKCEMDAFLKEFVDEGQLEQSRAVEIAEKLREDDKDVVYMSTLSIELVPDNFLKTEFKDQTKRITSVEFMKLWDHYDVDGNGFLDKVELKRFFYDMIMKNKDDDEPGENSDDLEERIDAYVKVMFQRLEIKDGKVQLQDMCKFCPVEENFLEQYENSVDDAELEEIFSHYDQDNSDEIEGWELEGFLKDLYEVYKKKSRRRPGKTFEQFKEEKMRVFDKNKDNKFNKKEVKKILSSR